MVAKLTSKLSRSTKLNEEGAVTQEVGRHAFVLPHDPDDVERIILGILALFERLNGLDSLEPNPQNAKLFNQLFDLVTLSKTTAGQDQKILNDPRIVHLVPQLWKLWGDAEYLLERAFSRRVVAGKSSTSCLKIYRSFPYLDQYRQLARMEVNTIDTALGELSLPPVRRIAFLGSGPTPFTSLCFQERYGASLACLNVDRNAEALRCSSDLVRCCGFSNISFRQANVESISDLEDYDVVHLAAMVGEDAGQKRDLVIRISQCVRPGTLILLRSTDSLRTVLYPKFEVDDDEMLRLVTPVVATRYFGGSTSLTAIVVKVDGVAAHSKLL